MVTTQFSSHDSGQTVHADYQLFTRKFNNIFQRLNLAPHMVRDKVLYGPGDIEGTSLLFSHL